jgi:outer membrane receptor protein involved in Fe transport
MNYRIKSTQILSVIFILFLSSTNAQEMHNKMNQGKRNVSGKISGTVLDAKTLQPIEYATVVLHKKRDESIVNGTVTDSKGKFVFDQVSMGGYFLKVSFIGFVTQKLDSIFIFPQKTEYDFSSIILEPKTVTTKEVTITSQREAITYNLDKKVISAEKLLTSMGGTALDVMQNIPAVNVDIDGNISMRGSSNLTILIDGRPSGLSGISSSDVLAQIPASSIETVELVTNPSAKYDPEGTAGIINIILKKKTSLGFNGIITANVGTKDKYNSSINLNLRNSYYNFFAAYDNRLGNMNMISETERTNTINNITSLIDQYQSSFSKNRMHNINVGGDYFPDDKNTFTLSLQHRNMNSINSSDLSNKNFDTNNLLTRDYARKSNSDRVVKSYDYTLSYKRAFDTKNQEFTFDFLFSDNKMNRTENIDQAEFIGSSLPVLQKSVSANTNKMFVIQSNYIHPIGDIGRIEAGFKNNFKNLTTNNSYYNFSSLSSSWINSSSLNDFKINEHVHAVYGIWTSGVADFKYQIGLRAEQVYYNSKLVTTSQEFDNNYFSLYPTIHFGYQFTPLDEVQLSYTRRVDRPSNRQLNPFVDFSDSLNIVYGNPTLKPQYINSYEIGYSKTIGFTSINSTLFYRQTDGMISTVSRLTQGGGTISTFQNIASSKSAGVEFIVVQPLAQWWRVNANFSYFNIKIEDQAVNNNANSWTLKFNSMMTMWWDVQFMLSANYNSPSILIGAGGFFGGGGHGRGGEMSLALSQTKLKELYSVDLGFKKDLFDNKISVTLRVSDLLNTRKFNSTTNGTGFLLDNMRRMDSRIVFLGITYRLNSNEKMKEREKRIDDTDDEL